MSKPKSELQSANAVKVEGKNVNDSKQDWRDDLMELDEAYIQFIEMKESEEEEDEQLVAMDIEEENAPVAIDIENEQEEKFTETQWDRWSEDWVASRVNSKKVNDLYEKPNAIESELKSTGDFTNYKKIKIEDEMLNAANNSAHEIIQQIKVHSKVMEQPQIKVHPYITACDEYIRYLDKARQTAVQIDERYRMLIALANSAKDGLKTAKAQRDFEKNYREMKHNLPRLIGKNPEHDKVETKFFRGMNDTKALNQKAKIGFFSKQIATHKSHRKGHAEARSIGKATEKEVLAQKKESQRTAKAYTFIKQNKTKPQAQVSSRNHAAAHKKKH